VNESFAGRGRSGFTFGRLSSWTALVLALASTASPAAEAAGPSQPPPDPRVCGDGVVMQAVAALGYKGDADFWKGGPTACRLRPEDPSEAIVALTYTPGDEKTGFATTPEDDPGYDLDVVVVRTGDGSLVARSPRAHVESDAVRFEGIAIDTANYTLAPGLRAFGLRVEHAAHCYHCNYGTVELALYVQRGERLDRVLDTTVHETRGEWGDCDNPPSETIRTIKVLRAASHGLADLAFTTTTAVQPDDDAPAACKAGSPPTVEHAAVHFDGKAYKVPPAIDAR